MRFFIPIRIITILILSTAAIFSCKKENDNNYTNNGLIPLRTGNKWTYESHQYSGKALSSSYTIEIGALVNINGYKGYKILRKTLPHNSTFLVNTDDEGNFISVGGYSDVDSLFTPSINYKKNAIKGESWEYQEVYVDYDNGIFDQELINVHCINTDSLITTPKGTFHCI